MTRLPCCPHLQGTVFDYYPALDGDQVHMMHWSTRVPPYVPSGDLPLVPTVETARLGHLLDLLVPNGHHVMLVGPAGTGKTAIVRDKLRSLDPEAFTAYTINLNSKHDGPSLQPVLEGPLEKKAGAWGGGKGEGAERGGCGAVRLSALCPPTARGRTHLRAHLCWNDANPARRHALWTSGQQKAHLLCG